MRTSRTLAAGVRHSILLEGKASGSVPLLCRVFAIAATACLPTTMFAAYNQISAPKTLALALEANHPVIPEQNDLSNKWLIEFLKPDR